MTEEPEPQQGRRKIAIVGDEAECHLSQAAFRAVAPAIEFVSFNPTVEEFDSLIKRLTEQGFAGASIGNPHKAAAAKLAVDYFRMRQGLGVANALKLGVHVVAQNTEVPGFGHFTASLPVGTALVLGSGRAARSALQALSEQGWKIRLWNRNVIRSKPLVAFFEYYGKIESISQADPTGCSLIVNATTLGAKAGEQPPVLWDKAKPRTTCIDFVFRGVATEFLRSAAALGFHTVDGRELLAERAALALEWWTGVTVPRQPMRVAVGLKS